MSGAGSRPQRDWGLRIVAVLGLLMGAAALYFWVVVADDRVYSRGPSMNPTMRGVDSIEVDFDAYESATPERGDIVALQAPADLKLNACEVRPPPGAPCDVVDRDYAPVRLVKRVVAAGGDRVSFALDGRLILNGTPQDEPYVRPCRPGCGLPRAITVPPDSYFVAGDNRRNSTDSRIWGPVPLEAIDGRVVLAGDANDDSGG